MVYKCPICGGNLEYHEQSLEHGEHHVCVECGEIYPHGKPSSEGFEGQASGCEKAEKPRDEGS